MRIMPESSVDGFQWSQQFLPGATHIRFMLQPDPTVGWESYVNMRMFTYFVRKRGGQQYIEDTLSGVDNLG